MCRIAGILNYQSPPTKEIIVAMRDAMQRGGPDDSFAHKAFENGIERHFCLRIIFINKFKSIFV